MNNNGVAFHPTMGSISSLSSVATVLPFSSNVAMPLPAAPDATTTARWREKRHNHAVQIAADRSGDLPPGFPAGPWESLEVAVEAITIHCRDLISVGLGHGVVKPIGLKPATRDSGAKQLVKCYMYHAAAPGQGGKRKRGGHGTACPWQLWIRESVEGWVVGDCKLDHNHELCNNQTTALLQPTMRCIPKALHDLAEILKTVGEAPATITR
jgi:hypothetical protein